MSAKPTEEIKFIFLDDNHQTLASAVLTNQSGQMKSFRLTYTPKCNLESLEQFNAMSVNSPEFMAWRGHIQRMRGDRIDFLAEEHIDARLRRHFRIPLSFRTYLYPSYGHGTRLPIISKDISCGGIALHCVTPLKLDAKYEIALPCTEPPILVKISVSRVISAEKNLYACQFIDLLPQEEAMIQESIFEYDLHNHSA